MNSEGTQDLIVHVLAPGQRYGYRVRGHYDPAAGQCSDAVATWSAAAPLNSNADSDTGDDSAPQLSTG